MIRGEGEKLSGGGTSSETDELPQDRGPRCRRYQIRRHHPRGLLKWCAWTWITPEILEFVNWKVEEEKKVGALIAAGYSSDYEGDAYRTVSGQNSNNSVRIPNSFFHALEADGDWELKARMNGKTDENRESHRPLEPDRLCGLALCRPRHPVRYYHQRMAYLSARWPHQRVQSLLRIHVPGQYRL